MITASPPAAPYPPRTAPQPPRNAQAPRRLARHGAPRSARRGLALVPAPLVTRLAPLVTGLAPLVTGLALVVTGLALTGCFPPQPKAAVSMKLAPEKGTPADATVVIDDQFIGPLGYVAERGVRLPLGEHHITVEKVGYFPWDALVVADRKPLRLKVQLGRIPE